MRVGDAGYFASLLYEILNQVQHMFQNEGFYLAFSYTNLYQKLLVNPFILEHVLGLIQYPKRSGRKYPVSP